MTHDDTPTPRTDAIHQKYITAAFARQLERELTAMTEQRDRLAEALKEIYNVSAFDYDSMPEIARRKYREVVSEMADVALQSLNQH